MHDMKICKPCLGIGGAWGRSDAGDCPLCNGVGMIPYDPRRQLVCRRCLGSGRKNGREEELCNVCGGEGVLPPPDTEPEPTPPAREVIDPPNFMQLGMSPELCRSLDERWKEAQICVENGAYLSAMIMMGGLLEGMLLGALQMHEDQLDKVSSAPRSKGGKLKPFEDWVLNNMIQVARELEWINADVDKLSHSVREYRNLIHPHRQVREENYPDIDTCRMAWPVVQAAANQLARVLSA